MSNNTFSDIVVKQYKQLQNQTKEIKNSLSPAYTNNYDCDIRLSPNNTIRNQAVAFNSKGSHTSDMTFNGNRRKSNQAASSLTEP